MRIKIAALIVAVFVLFGFPVQAQEIMPSMPALCYGELTVNGLPASAGIEVQARVEGVSCGSLVTDETGGFGGPGIQTKLAINGQNLTDKSVEFYVSGVCNGMTVNMVKAGEAAFWGYGEVKEMNLAITLEDSSDGASGNNNGGASSSKGNAGNNVSGVSADSSEDNAGESAKNVILTDIRDHWAVSNITDLVGEGVIKGYPDGTFKPENTITRAEFVTALAAAFNLENKNSKVYNDTQNHWAKEYVSAAAEAGIVQGVSENEFAPDVPITREQMAVMIVKAAGLKNSSNDKVFTDSACVSSWAESAIAIASYNNIISGYSDNTFRPAANATRAEAVTIICRALR